MSGKIQAAVSFEGERIKIVEAAAREGRLAIKEVLTLPRADFALYLKRTNNADFFVACDFPDLIHEVIHVPPAKDKYVRALVEREVARRFPDVKDPSVVFHPLREQVKDGKKALEVMVYIIEKERLRDVVNIFEANGKRVSFLYPAILPIARLVHGAAESQDEILLTVIDGGPTKTLLVSQGGQILFLRTIQSRASGIDDIDADNINMTVTYSRQTLRAEPARCVILNTQEASDIEDCRNRLLLPALNMALPAGVLHNYQSNHGNIYSAIALFLFSSDLRWGNMVPPEHTAYFRKKSILKYGAGFFICSSLALSAYSFRVLAEVPRLKAQMREIRTDMAQRQSVWTEWIRARDELDAYMPLISFSNLMESSSDVLSALRHLSFLPVKDISIRALRFSNTPEGTKVEIKGELTADRYGEMSAVYQRLLEGLKGTGAVEVRSNSLEVKTRSFSIEGLLRQERAASDE